MVKVSDKHQERPVCCGHTVVAQVRVLRPGSSCAGASVRVTSPVREEEKRGEEEGGRGAHKVLLRLRQERGRGEEKVGRREKNRTWGQATLQKGRERGAVKDLDYSPNYENVYGAEEEDEGIGRGRSASGKRTRELYRSKSCDRAGVRGTVRDQVGTLLGICTCLSASATTLLSSTLALSSSPAILSSSPSSSSPPSSSSSSSPCR